MPFFLKNAFLQDAYAKSHDLSYFERCHPTQNLILQLLSRLGHLPSYCTTSRTLVIVKVIVEGHQKIFSTEK